MSYELLGLGDAPVGVGPTIVPSSVMDDVPETKPFTFVEFMGSTIFAFAVGMVAMHLIDRYTLGTRTVHDREAVGDLDRGRFFLQKRDARRALEVAERREQMDRDADAYFHHLKYAKVRTDKGDVEIPRGGLPASMDHSFMTRSGAAVARKRFGQ